MWTEIVKDVPVATLRQKTAFANKDSNLDEDPEVEANKGKEKKEKKEKKDMVMPNAVGH